jgi:hypothetical protein
MTIESPQKTISDKLLKRLGKRRAVYIPDAESTFGPHVYTKAKKEPFLRALFRSENKQLPDNWIYLDDLEKRS